MDHRVAEERNAVDRYLLGEFTEEERREFEEHLFDCTICAEQVRENAVIVDNLKEVLWSEPLLRSSDVKHEAARKRNWGAWLRLPILAPSLAALLLAAVAGYQRWVVIPGLERPEVLSNLVLAPQTREAAPVVTMDRRLPRFNLNFSVDAPQAYSAYLCDFENENGSPIVRVGSGPEKVASFTLGIALSARDFPPGRYVMVLRPVSSPQTEVQRYSFVIQDGATR